MNSHEVFIHIHQGCFAGTGAIVRLPQCQWSKPDGYGKISQCITTTKHSKAKTVCIFLGIYCTPYTCNTNVIYCYLGICKISFFLNNSAVCSLGGTPAINLALRFCNLFRQSKFEAYVLPQTYMLYIGIHSRYVDTRSQFPQDTNCFGLQWLCIFCR